MKAFIGRFTLSAAELEAEALFLLLLLLLLVVVLAGPVVVLLLLLLLVLLLVGVGTWVWGGEWALMLPTDASEGVDRDEVSVELREVRDEWCDKE